MKLLLPSLNKTNTSGRCITQYHVALIAPSPPHGGGVPIRGQDSSESGAHTAPEAARVCHNRVPHTVWLNGRHLLSYSSGGWEMHCEEASMVVFLHTLSSRTWREREQALWRVFWQGHQSCSTRTRPSELLEPPRHSHLAQIILTVSLRDPMASVAGQFMLQLELTTKPSLLWAPLEAGHLPSHRTEGLEPCSQLRYMPLPESKKAR